MIKVLLNSSADFQLKNDDGLTPQLVTAFAIDNRPNPNMFQEIFNGLTEKMNSEEKVTALELIGSSYISQNQHIW